MPLTRRYIADSLTDDAHALLSGAKANRIISELEFRIQDLQELEEIESAAEKKKNEEKQSHKEKT